MSITRFAVNPGMAASGSALDGILSELVAVFENPNGEP